MLSLLCQTCKRLRENQASIIDRNREVEPEYVSYYGYQKLEPPFRFPKPIWRME